MGRNKSINKTKRELLVAQTELVKAKAAFWNELSNLVKIVGCAGVLVKSKRSGDEPPEGAEGETSLLEDVGNALKRYGDDGQ